MGLAGAIVSGRPARHLHSLLRLFCFRLYPHNPAILCPAPPLVATALVVGWFGPGGRCPAAYSSRCFRPFPGRPTVWLRLRAAAAHSLPRPQRLQRRFPADGCPIVLAGGPGGAAGSGRSGVGADKWPAALPKRNSAFARLPCPAIAFLNYPFHP